MFLRITDHIDYRLYLLLGIPQDYGVMPSYFFEESSAGPIMIPYDGESGRGQFAIRHMIDMYYNKIPFEFAEPGDLLDVEKHLAYFIEYIKRGKVSSREFTEFMKKVSAFNDVIRKHATLTRAKYPEHQLKASPFLSAIQTAGATT